MPDDNQPTGALTGDPATASLTGPGAGNPVNPAQAQSQQTPPSTLDVSGMIAQYEARLRTLMSDKDKAIHERNQSITAQAEMQRALTELQAQSTATVASSVDAAQRAIDENKRLAARVQMLEADQMRSQVVLKEPDLAAYIDFIPATNNPEELNAAVEKLKAIREQDLARSRQAPYTPIPQPNPATTPTTNPNSPYGLYAGRTNMAPMTQLPASSPALMNPTGAGSTLQAIEAMLADARNSGDPTKFEAAVQQAALLAKQDVNAQLGRM